MDFIARKSWLVGGLDLLTVNLISPKCAPKVFKIGQLGYARAVGSFIGHIGPTTSNTTMSQVAWFLHTGNSFILREDDDDV